VPTLRFLPHRHLLTGGPFFPGEASLRASASGVPPLASAHVAPPCPSMASAEGAPPPSKLLKMEEAEGEASSAGEEAIREGNHPLHEIRGRSWLRPV